MTETMVLDEAQIERYSRQIILPQVGGAGQQRLLQASVAVAGEGEAAATLAAYLVGAGVGHLAWQGAAAESAALAGCNPDVTVVRAVGPLGAMGCGDVLAACDVGLAELDGAARTRRPLVAGGVRGHCGWLVVAAPGGSCAGCAARTALGALPPAARAARGVLSSPTAGVVGSLMALEILKLLLGRGSAPPGWLQFDGATSTLEAHPIAPLGPCPACAAE